jgi:glutathione synthase
MKSLFIIDPPEQLMEDCDSSIALMRETVRRGGEVDVCTPEDLCLNERGNLEVDARLIKPREGRDWFTASEVRTHEASAYDVVWMRKDPPFDLSYFHATLLLSHAPASTLIVNAASALREANEKLYALRFPKLCPETIVTGRIQKLVDFRDRVGGKIVVKPIHDAGGRGVFLVRAGDDSADAILDAATVGGTRRIIAQRYLPEVCEGDKRIILVEGRPVGAVLRVPQPGELLANLHAGGSPVRTSLSDRDREICDRIGPELSQLGVVFAGIDVIGDYLTEINVTSPTGIREIEKLDGIRLETDILDAVEQRLH